MLAHIAAYADRDLRADLQPARGLRWMDDRRLNEWPGS